MKVKMESQAHGGRPEEAPRHPLDIQPLSSERRFKQPPHDIFAPLPIKAYYCAPSSGGKSSAAIQAINALWPC